MKFATRLLLGLSGTILVGATTMITVGGGQTARLLEKQLTARLEDNAYHMLEKLDRYFAERVSEVRAFTVDPSLFTATASPEQTAGYLREFLRWHPEFLSAAFFTMDGVAVADTDGTRAGGQEAPGGCWADLAAGKESAVCVSPPSPGERSTIHFAVVVNDGLATRGAVVLRLPLQLFEEQLRQPPGSRGSVENLHIDLVDRAGVYLYSNYEQEGLLQEVSPDWVYLQEQVRRGQASGSLRYTNPKGATGEEILVYVRERGFGGFVGGEWTLILFVPTREAFAPVHEMRLRIGTVVLGTATTLLTLMFILVRAFTRPIGKLGLAAQEIGKGNLGARVSVSSRDELGLFAETFNQMAGSMEGSQRELAASKRALEEKAEERTLELLHTNEALHAELSGRVKAQEALEVRERLLRLNADIGEAMTLGEALPEVLQRCAGNIVRDLDAAFVRIWMLGDEVGVLELKASAGVYTRLDGQHSRKIVGTGKIGIIAQEQRPILTNAVLSDPAIADHEWARLEGMVAFAGHPLVVEGKTVGVMALFSRRSIEPFVLSALENVAHRIAAFIGRKRAEEALSASENRYRELFDSASDGIYRSDARGAFASMNRAGARIFGYENPEDIIGRPVLDYWRDQKDRERLRRDLEREKAVSSWRIPARNKNGDPLELETSSRILEGPAGEFLGIEGVLRDVTERVKSEAERDLLLAQLQEAAANIRTLSGLLPICAGCKKIRDDQGSWSQIETYIRSHSEAKFTHGLCPDCQKVYFPSVGGKP